MKFKKKKKKKKNFACLCWVAENGCVEESLCGGVCNAIGEDSAALSTRSLGLRKIKGFVCSHNKMHSFGKKKWREMG